MNQSLTCAVCSLLLGLLFPSWTHAGNAIEGFAPPSQRDPATTSHRTTPLSRRLLFERNAPPAGHEHRFTDTTSPGDDSPARKRSSEISAIGQFRIFSASLNDSSVIALEQSVGDRSSRGQAAEAGALSGSSIIAAGLSDLRHSQTNDAAGFDDRAPAPVEFAEIVSALTALPEPNSLSLALLGAALAGALPLRRWRKRESQEEMGLSAD